METNPLRIRTQTGPTPPTPAGPPKPPEAPASTPNDQVELKPKSPQTLKQLFASLKSLGLDPGRDAAARMSGSLRAGYESLITFQGEKGNTISLRNQAELEEYLSLKGNGPASEAVTAALPTLRSCLEQGDHFYLKRGKEMLETDAAGAALVLARGEEVVRRRVDGVSEPWKAVPAEPTAAEPEKARVGKLLDRAEALECAFAPEPDEKAKKKPIQSALAKLIQALQIRDQRPGDRARLIGDLSSGKSVLLTLPDDERKIALPAAINAKQLESYLDYLTAPTPEQKEFQQAFEAIGKDQGVVMAACSNPEAKGMLMAASDQSAYLNLVAGQEVVVLAKDGLQYRLTKPEQLVELQKNGSVASTPGTPLDPSQPSDNLFMVYAVSPFDPIKKGVYDDLMLRMQEVGSSPQIDIVAMHSDLPEKKNLRVDRVQPGKLESLKKMDPETVMSDPKVFEEFIYETLMANQTDGKVRLFVGGHGGAEKGLLPDGKHNNAEASHAMAVDDFAGAIHLALDRVEKETGKRPFIENLMLCSCLMGNTSLINALAQTGDVGVLCASPEVMMGSSPNSIIEYLHSPEHSHASGEEFARYLVDTVSEAPASPGGSKEQHHADTYGAYRLDKRLARDFQDSLDGFFQTCLKHPDQAGAIKRAIASCPTYGVNPFLNLMFDIDNRDVIQVAESILKDARVTAPDIKEACEKLIKSTEEQVIAQKVTDNYKGRRGPTMYLPVDRFDFDEKMAKTALLQTTDYHKFQEMVFDAPLHRGVKDTFLTEANRLLEAAKDAKAGETQPEEAEKPAEKKDKTEKKKPEPNGKIIQQHHAAEEYHGDNVLKKLGRTVKGLVRVTTALAGGLAAAAVGAIPGAVVGALLGARAGFTGHSISSPEYGVKEEAEVSLGTVGRAVDLVVQAGLSPSERAGIQLNEKIGHRFGSTAASLVGSVGGMVGGALGGALAGAVLAGVPGVMLGKGVGKLATFWIPGDPPNKDFTKGLDSDLTTP